MATKEQLSQKADWAVNSIRSAQQKFDNAIKQWTNFNERNPRNFKKHIKQHAKELNSIANSIK